MTQEQKAITNEIYSKIDESIGTVEPAFVYASEDGIMLTMTKAQLHDYARRVFKVSVGLTTL